MFSREKAGLRTGCGIRSQVIYVLEAQIKRRPATKKLSTAAVKQTKNFPAQKPTIGLDLGDRSSWYCVLDEAGAVIALLADVHLRLTLPGISPSRLQPEVAAGVAALVEAMRIFQRRLTSQWRSL